MAGWREEHEILEVDKEASVPDLQVVNKTTTMVLIISCCREGYSRGNFSVCI